VRRRRSLRASAGSRGEIPGWTVEKALQSLAGRPPHADDDQRRMNSPEQPPQIVGDGAHGDLSAGAAGTATTEADAEQRGELGKHLSHRWLPGSVAVAAG
jgi:hypothetical protein